jgi:hypothetical protein
MGAGTLQDNVQPVGWEVVWHYKLVLHRPTIGRGPQGGKSQWYVNISTILLKYTLVPEALLIQTFSAVNVEIQV